MKRASDLEHEEWRVIIGFPDYAVSNLGRFKRLASYNCAGIWHKEKILKTHNATIRLRKGGQKFKLRLGAIILEVFGIPAPPGKELARHLDDNRQNNRLDNLAWGDHADNFKDAQRNGKAFIGPGTKLSEEHKRKIGERGRGKVASLSTKLKLSELTRKQRSLEKELGIKRKFPSSLTFSGRRHTEDAKNKVRQDKIGKIWITNGLMNQFVDPNIPIPEGWRRGMAAKKRPQRA